MPTLWGSRKTWFWSPVSISNSRNKCTSVFSELQWTGWYRRIFLAQGPAESMNFSQWESTSQRIKVRSEQGKMPEINLWTLPKDTHPQTHTKKYIIHIHKTQTKYTHNIYTKSYKTHTIPSNITYIAFVIYCKIS